MKALLFNNNKKVTRNGHFPVLQKLTHLCRQHIDRKLLSFPILQRDLRDLWWWIWRLQMIVMNLSLSDLMAVLHGRYTCWPFHQFRLSEGRRPHPISADPTNYIANVPSIKMCRRRRVPKKLKYDFPSKGRLELFRKFIRFGRKPSLKKKKHEFCVREKKITGRGRITGSELPVLKKNNIY